MTGTGIQPVDITSEVKTNFINYAMNVIVDRALPDVRDGMKPVQRRIMYAMLQEGLASNVKHAKSASVVGEVMKRYHPHGDSSIYDAMVRLGQWWNMRYTMVDPQGNFGSMDGDMAAAMRYTEARMTKVAEEVLAKLEARAQTLRIGDPLDKNTDVGAINSPTQKAKIDELVGSGALGAARGEFGEHLLLVARRHPVEDRAEQLLLGGEVVHQPGLGDPGGPGSGVEGERAALAEMGIGRVEHRLAGRGAVRGACGRHGTSEFNR